MKENTPNIILIYPSDFPDDIIKYEVIDFVSANLNIAIQKNKNVPYAAFEWIIPTAFGVYILKPYFESFLSEMGKDHFSFLKQGLKKFIDKGKQFKFTLHAATLSSNKLSGTYNQSSSVSIIFQTTNNKQIKLLFDDEMKIEEWESAIDELFEYLIENYELFPNDKLTQLINDKTEKEYDVIYGIINPISKHIEFYNGKDLRLKYKQ